MASLEVKETDPQTPRSPLSPRDLDMSRCYHVLDVLCNPDNNRKVINDHVLGGGHDMIYCDLFGLRSINFRLR